MTTPPARALYLDVSPDPVFAVFHAAGEPDGRDPGRVSPGPPGRRTGVLLVPPFGWNDVTSYRARRAWAERLAGDGHPTLRFDFPGAGDSGGVPGDADRLGSWSRTIGAAAAWLRASTGCDRIALIGMGLGGLVAAKAIADGALIDDLVLWAAPAHGRAFIRGERAFANMQASRYSLAGEPEPAVLPDGWMEVGGFVLSAETLEGIGSLTLDGTPVGSVRRALLLDNDGIAVDPAIRTHLEAAGVEVSLARGPGWGAMTFHPEKFDPPLAVFDAVGSWLAAAPDAAPEAPPHARPTALAPAPSGRDVAELEVDGVRIRESPFVVALPAGRFFGILSEPIDASRPGLCAVFLNAGAVRRIGPNRLWVEVARRAAAGGLPTLRIDLEGIGDSDGDAGLYRDVTKFYRAALGEQIGAFLDALEARGYGDRFVLAGLCAGGYWAFNAAAADERVVSAFLLNPGALEWHPELFGNRTARKLSRLRQGAWWRRILRGQVKRRNMVAVARATANHAWRAIRSVPRRATRRGREQTASAPSTPVESLLDRLRDKGTRVVMAFSEDEPVRTELARDGVLARLDRWPNLELDDLPARDHTLRPIVAQRGVHDLLDREFARELERATAIAGSATLRGRPGSKGRASPRRRGVA
jgi:alpha-beta hydrolase superfamily lysophospholipase